MHLIFRRRQWPGRVSAETFTTGSRRELSACSEWKTYRMRQTSGDIPACSSSFLLPEPVHLGWLGRIAGRLGCAVPTAATEGRQSASIGSASASSTWKTSPNGPWDHGPSRVRISCRFRRRIAVAPRSTQKGVCPCRRRCGTAEGGTDMTLCRSWALRLRKGIWQSCLLPRGPNSI